MDLLTYWNQIRWKQLNEQDRRKRELEAFLNGPPLPLEAPTPYLATLFQKLDLARAVEQSAVPVLMTDVKGAIHYVNPRFSEFTGFASEEVLGRNPRIFKSGQMPSKIYRELWNTICRGRECTGELHNKKKNGEVYWEFVSISPVVDDAGQVTHFVSVKEDITRRKQVESEREGLIGELQETVRNLRRAGADPHDPGALPNNSRQFSPMDGHGNFRGDPFGDSNASAAISRKSAVNLQAQRNNIMPPTNTATAGQPASRPGREEIAHLAIQLWEMRGRPNDCDEEIWLHAEQQLLKSRGDAHSMAARPTLTKTAASRDSALNPQGRSTRLAG